MSCETWKEDGAFDVTGWPISQQTCVEKRNWVELYPLWVHLLRLWKISGTRTERSERRQDDGEKGKNTERHLTLDEK